MNLPKHQHWVPQFYLRYFSTPETRSAEEQQVWIFSKDEADDEAHITNVRKICGKRYLYTPLDKAGQRKWDLETKLEALESSMGQIWPGIADDFIDLSDDSMREGLSLFIAVMHLRNPEVRRDAERLHQQLVEAYEAMPMSSQGKPAIELIEVNDAIHEFNASGWHEYKAWGKNDHDRFFTHLIQREAIQIARILMKKRWSVVFSERQMFITSDRPVVLQHQTKEAFGFGTNDAIIWSPLSQTRLLIMDDLHSEPANQYYPLKHDYQGIFNYSTWRGCSRFLITGRPVAEVLSEIVACADAAEDGAA